MYDVVYERELHRAREALGAQIHAMKVDLVSLFGRVDRNHDGEIDRHEFEAVARPVLGEDDWNDVFARADVDHSGTLDFDEFAALLVNHATLGQCLERIVREGQRKRSADERARMETFFKCVPSTPDRRYWRPGLADLHSPGTLRHKYFCTRAED